MVSRYNIDPGTLMGVKEEPEGGYVAARDYDELAARYEATCCAAEDRCYAQADRIAKLEAALRECHSYFQAYDLQGCEAAKMTAEAIGSVPEARCVHGTVIDEQHGCRECLAAEREAK